MCTKPLKAYQSPEHGVTFTPKGVDPVHIELPCGNCIECRLNHAKERTIRCVNEASMFNNNIFATLTFDNKNLPKDRNLDWEILKKFIKRLRSHNKQKIRYFACGEYGGEFKNDNNTWLWDRSQYTQEKKPKFPRAHFHILLFNYRPSDEQIAYVNKHKQNVYVSHRLQSIWKNGYANYGEVTTQSAGYVARYITKKQTSNNHSEWTAKYDQPLYDLETGEYICHHPATKELAFGSSVPAIGATWLQKYWATDCFNQGFIIGPSPELKKYPIPRYYWTWLEKNHYEQFQLYSREKALKYLINKQKIEADNTFERQDTKDSILNKKSTSLKREL